MKFTPEQYSALVCAVAVLDGTDGGYSKEDKYKAKCEILNFLVIMRQNLQD